MKNKSLTNKVISLTQITLLVISIIAMIYMISASFGIANASDIKLCTSKGGSCGDPNLCSGTVMPGLCSGSETNQCCVPLTNTAQSNNDTSKLGPDLLAAGGFLVTIFGPKNVFNYITGKTEVAGTAVKTATATTEKTALTIKSGEGTFEGGGPVKASLGKSLGAIAESAGVALAAGLVARYLAGALGFSTQHAQAIGWGVAAGVFAGLSVTSQTTMSIIGVTAVLGPVGILIGIGVAVVVTLFTWKKESSQAISFECDAWNPPTGGKDCTKCNNDLLPCSEYQCMSLGQSCALINVGTSEQKCVYNNSRDVQPPIIEPLQDVLTQNYKYTPDNTVSPPDRAVKIEYQNSQDGCIPAFSPITFGIQTNEPSMCKIDTQHTDSFDNMTFYFGGDSLLNTQHTQVISMPSKDSLASENITLQNGGNFQVYVRCQDANGNYNPGEFMFKYCVDQGPDVTAPEIAGTSIISGSPIAYNQTSISNVGLYVNEPVDGCRWSFSDQKYDDMPVSMDCSKAHLISDMNNQMLYSCTTTLVGLKSMTDNSFYFKCRDKSNNTDQNSYKLDLIGTQPLVLDSITPNGTTIKDSTNVIKVTLNAETSAGYNNGISSCYFSDRDVASSYVLFSNTESYQHSQDLFLEAGNYNYYVKCCDLGNNCDTKSTSFTVETDNQAPQVVRIYHDSNYLRFITDENATCVYDTVSCNYNFDDGIKITSMQGGYGTEQYTDWDTNKEYFIKCKDAFGNQPVSEQCSIIAKPFVDLTKKQ